MHDIAQDCYDKMAAAIAMFMSDVQERQIGLLKELQDLREESDRAMAARLKNWRGETEPSAGTAPLQKVIVMSDSDYERMRATEPPAVVEPPAPPPASPWAGMTLRERVINAMANMTMNGYNYDLTSDDGDLALYAQDLVNAEPILQGTVWNQVETILEDLQTELVAAKKKAETAA